MVKEFGRPAAAKPAWLRGLMAEAFFVPCGAHESARKNEKNVFCLCCCRSICPNCLPSHRSHPLLQVRRYVYHDVARLEDLEKLMDCSYIQPYTINNAKVVFLNQRPQARPFKGSGNNCLTCDRMLQDPYHYCSLACKVDGVVEHGGDLAGILYHRWDEPDYAFSQFEGLRVDGPDAAAEEEEEEQTTAPESILEGTHFMGSSGSSRAVEAAVSETAKKKKGNGLFPKMMISLGNRRKGSPHRAPLS